MMQVFSVYDVAAETFGPPITTAAVGLAVRSFTDAVNAVAKESPIAQHPKDFQLFHLGSFDETMGKFEMFPQPRRIAGGLDVLLPEKMNGGGYVSQ